MYKTKFILILFIFLFSCSNDDEIILLDNIQGSITNLHAPQTGGMGQPIGGDFTKFSFETGSATTSETNWDIAFRGTMIIVNGGEKIGTNDEPERTGTSAIGIVDGTFDMITTAEGSGFKQDFSGNPAIPTGSGKGWYNYSGPPTFVITPIPGKILVVKTGKKTYAKMEILSYYENAPSNPNFMRDKSRYYSFNYTYNPNIEDYNLE